MISTNAPSTTSQRVQKGSKERKKKGSFGGFSSSCYASSSVFTFVIPHLLQRKDHHHSTKSVHSTLVQVSCWHLVWVSAQVSISLCQPTRIHWTDTLWVGWFASLTLTLDERIDESIDGWMDDRLGRWSPVSEKRAWQGPSSKDLIPLSENKASHQNKQRTKDTTTTISTTKSAAAM